MIPYSAGVVFPTLGAACALTPAERGVQGGKKFFNDVTTLPIVRGELGDVDDFWRVLRVCMMVTVLNADRGRTSGLFS